MDVSSIWTSERHTHKTIVERMHALVVICVMYDKSLALYLCTQPSHLVCLHSNDILILIKYFVKKVDWIYKISIPDRHRYHTKYSEHCCETQCGLLE